MRWPGHPISRGLWVTTSSEGDADPPLLGFVSRRRNRRLRTLATFGLVLLGPVLTVATFLVLGPFGQGAGSPALRLILLADMVYILVVAALVLYRVARMVAARRARSAGSRLHLRLTGVFALLALLPTVAVAVFATITVNMGLESWFSDRVRNALGHSVEAAHAYQEEHRDDLVRGCRGAGRLPQPRPPQHALPARWRPAPVAQPGPAGDSARPARGLRDRRHRRDPGARRTLLPVRLRTPRRRRSRPRRRRRAGADRGSRHQRVPRASAAGRLCRPLSLRQPRGRRPDHRAARRNAGHGGACTGNWKANGASSCSSSA